MHHRQDGTKDPGVSADIDAIPVETDGLAALERRLAEDLACLNYPPPNWVIPAGEGVADVAIIGAGMGGLAAAFALLRIGIRNIRILDRNPYGLEGPWVTYARMETLRSPKELLGPAGNVPTLTFRAWFTAQFGTVAWEELGKIPRTMWMEYLVWYREVLALPVENNVDVARIRPRADGLLALDLKDGEITARKVIMATGRDGLGAQYIPPAARDLPPAYRAHTADDIDFAALRGRRVVVIGAGASAMDNAAEALEAGAAEVRLLVRRKHMPRINKLTGIGSMGFIDGWPALSEEWRWRLMHYSQDTQTPPPRNSTQRVSRHLNAFFHMGVAVEAMRLNNGVVEIHASNRRVFETDFVILGTGFTVDINARPEIAEYAGAIALWADRFVPPPDVADTGLGQFPYLAPDFAFTEKTPGDAPFLADIHCFNHAASLSLGKVAGDIPQISTGAAWLAQGIAAGLYTRDMPAYWRQLLDYDKPELFGDEWTDAEED